MKEMRPRFLLVFFLFMACFILVFIAVDVFVWNEIDYRIIVPGIPIAFGMIYFTVTLKVKYDENEMSFTAGWRERKIRFKDIEEISSSSNPGGYMLKFYDGKEVKDFLYFPFEHKRMRELFGAIEKANPDAQINIMWYKKEKHEKYVDFKTLIKWACFIVAICLADYVYQKFIK